MPRSESVSKEEFVSTRVAFTIKNVILAEARREGVTISEWLRNLIVSELRRRDLLPPRVPHAPSFKKPGWRK